MQTGFKSFRLFFVVMIFGLLSTTAIAGMPAELIKAQEDIYNANFSRASAIIEAYIKNKPMDAGGPLLRGMLKEWDQVINNKRNALNASIMADYTLANQLAQKAYDNDPQNIDNMILLGNTHMYMAKKYVDMGRKMKGGGELKTAKNLMLGVIEKNPNAYDAYFALGVFNYFSANVPGGLKWLTTLLGFNGTRAKGIEYTTKAAEHKNLTQGDAAFLLVYIHGEKEKNYPVALQYIRQMKDRYPYNSKFQYDEAELLYKAKKTDEALSALNTFLVTCQSKGKDCNDKYKYLAYYHLARIQTDKQDYKAAAPFAEAAVKVADGQYKGSDVELQYWLGMAAKVSGDQEKAAVHFKKVEESQKNNPKIWTEAQKQMAVK